MEELRRMQQVQDFSSPPFQKAFLAVLSREGMPIASALGIHRPLQSS